jgi:RNA polymerase subunit RPABC4/transcription elongation factor Spt4
VRYCFQQALCLTFLEANGMCPKVKEHPDYPKCWRGSVIVFDTERRNTVVSSTCPDLVEYKPHYYW